MSAWSWFVIGTFLAVYGVLALLALRRPLLARLAFREAWRGGLQTGLVVAGLALAGMGITAGLVAADSTEASVTQNAYLSMGEVDVTVTANGALFDASVADRLAADRKLATVIDGVQGGLDLVGAVADLDQRACWSAATWLTPSTPSPVTGCGSAPAPAPPRSWSPASSSSRDPVPSASAGPSSHRWARSPRWPPLATRSTWSGCPRQATGSPASRPVAAPCRR